MSRHLHHHTMSRQYRHTVISGKRCSKTIVSKSLPLKFYLNLYLNLYHNLFPKGGQILYDFIFNTMFWIMTLECIYWYYFQGSRAIFILLVLPTYLGLGLSYIGLSLICNLKNKNCHRTLKTAPIDAFQRENSKYYLLVSTYLRNFARPPMIQTKTEPI